MDAQSPGEELDPFTGQPIQRNPQSRRPRARQAANPAARAASGLEQPAVFTATGAASGPDRPNVQTAAREPYVPQQPAAQVAAQAALGPLQSAAQAAARAARGTERPAVQASARAAPGPERPDAPGTIGPLQMAMQRGLRTAPAPERPIALTAARAAPGSQPAVVGPAQAAPNPEQPRALSAARAAPSPERPAARVPPGQALPYTRMAAVAPAPALVSPSAEVSPNRGAAPEVGLGPGQLYWRDRIDREAIQEDPLPTIRAPLEAPLKPIGKSRTPASAGRAQKGIGKSDLSLMQALTAEDEKPVKTEQAELYGIAADLYAGKADSTQRPAAVPSTTAGWQAGARRRQPVQKGVPAATLAAAAETVRLAPPEPLYGLAAELANPVPVKPNMVPEPLPPLEDDYGLAAEVARRHAYIKRRSPQGSPARWRRRAPPSTMAPPLASFGFADAPPAPDPFAAVPQDDVLFPDQEGVKPYVPQERDATDGGDITLLDALDDGAEGGLDQQPSLQRQKSRYRADSFRSADGVNPHHYVLDEDTGTLVMAGQLGGRVAGHGESRQYVEDAGTGGFVRVGGAAARWWQWATAWRQRRVAAQQAQRNGGPTDWYGDEREQGFRYHMASTSDVLANSIITAGFASQCLLGGFSLLSFLMTFNFYINYDQRQFLAYYSPIAMLCNRIFFTLIALSVVPLGVRLTRNGMKGGPRLPREEMTWLVWAQLVMFGAAYVLNVLMTASEDAWSHEARVIPRFYDLPLSSNFSGNYSLWKLLNLGRMGTSFLGFLLVCYQFSPLVMRRLVQEMYRKEAQRRLAKMEGRDLAGGSPGGMSATLVRT